MWGVEWHDCGSAGKLTDGVGCFWIMIGSIRGDFWTMTDTWVGDGFLGHITSRSLSKYDLWYLSCCWSLDNDDSYI